MIFQRSLAPFHSHTQPYHNEVTEDTQGQERDIILFKEKSINSSPPTTFFSVSGTAANNKSAKQVSGFEREITRKGMKGMDGYFLPKWFAFVFSAENSQ